MDIGFWFREQAMKWRRLIGQTDMSSTGINQRSMITAIAAVVVLVAALWSITCQLRGGRRAPAGSREVYYYDVNTNSVFASDAASIPPIDAPSGKPGPDGVPAGVRAHIYSCGACNESDWFIAYLQRYTLEARQRILELRQQSDTGEMAEDIYMEMSELEMSTLIADPDELNWVPIESEEADAIRSQLAGKCTGSRPKPCYPGR